MNGSTCEIITKFAGPRSFKKHWGCTQWTSYCCKCQTLTTSIAAPTTQLGIDCIYPNASVPSTCQ
jgi:hypothetical protein